MFFLVSEKNSMLLQKHDSMSSKLIYIITYFINQTIFRHIFSLKILNTKY